MCSVKEAHKKLHSQRTCLLREGRGGGRVVDLREAEKSVKFFFFLQNHSFETYFSFQKHICTYMFTSKEMRIIWYDRRRGRVKAIVIIVARKKIGNKYFYYTFQLYESDKRLHQVIFKLQYQCYQILSRHLTENRKVHEVPPLPPLLKFEKHVHCTISYYDKILSNLYRASPRKVSKSHILGIPFSHFKHFCLKEAAK